MTTTIPATGLVYDLADPAYRARPGLSSTGVKQILDSPARYRYDSTHPVHKHVFDIGHAVHAKVLGAGLEYERLDFDAWTTKAAREARDDVRRRGLVPLLAKEAAQVEAMAEAVLAHDDARALLEAPGSSEVSCFWTDPGTRVALKGRFDRLLETPIIVDVKTTGTSAKPSSLRSYAARYGWGEQACHYRDGAQTVTGTEHRFVHVCVETAEPYLVSVIELDADFLAIAEARRRHAVATYARCLETDTWPGYPTGLNRLTPPGWFGTYDLEDPE